MQMAGSSSNPKQGTPSFFKIILEPSKPYLALPYGFVEKDLKKKIPRNSKIKTGTGEHSWNVKIKTIKGSCCFVDGWCKVVKDTKLGFGDALLFWLIDDSTFQISVYSSDGCEKELSSNFTDYCDGCVKTKKNLKVKNVTKIRDDDEDDGLLDVREISGNDDGEEEEEEEDDDEDEDEDYDDDDDDDCEEDCDDEDEDEDENDDGSGGDVLANDSTRGLFTQHEKHLSYRKVITKGQRFQSCIPARFARRSKLDRKKKVMVIDLKGRESSLGIYHHDDTRHYLCAGWSIFRKENKIADGDICVFKFIKSEKKLALTEVVKEASVALTRKRGRASGIVKC